MPTTLPADQDIDPTELADQDDTQEETDDLAVVADDEHEPVAIDADAEIVAEIEKVAGPVEEDDDDAVAPTAKKAGMISEELIQKPLSFEDLYDEGFL